MTAITTTISLSTVLLLAFVCRRLVRIYIKPVDIWNIPVDIPDYFIELDREMVAIGQKDAPSKENYRSIFKYFIYGVHAYSSESRARIIYPGVSGTRGSTVEGLEGFARTSVLISAWLAAGRDTIINLEKANAQYDLIEHLCLGLEAGTNPAHPEYWGDICDYDQRTVEAADIALCIWMTRDILFSKLQEENQRKILSWLSQIEEKKIYGGNWLLFRIIVKAILNEMGQYQFEINQDYIEFKSFYIGDGWFEDGKGGAIDYYNAWQMHYMLFWLTKIDPSFDPKFINEVQIKFCKGFQYFISKEGFPAFGRSICYRLAIATPLINMANRYPNNWSGKARRSLDLSWSYFLKNGALNEGRITQGYFSQEEDLLENYSGRASPLWSLRSLVSAYYLKDCHIFWRNIPSRLPIEESSYNIYIPGPELNIEGYQDTSRIVLTRRNSFPSPIFYENTKFRKMSKLRKVMQKLLRRPLRHDNQKTKYGKKKYSSSDLLGDTSKSL